MTSSSDSQRVKMLLAEQNVSGTADFGRFVNNDQYFEPSHFDAVTALPLLISVLPTVTDGHVAESIAHYLKQKPQHPLAYRAAVDGFRSWAPHDRIVGWAFGDSIGSLAVHTDSEELRQLAADQTFGTSRQMIVHSLWRFKSTDPQIESLLSELIDDQHVGLHALNALQRVIGKKALLPIAEGVAERHDGSPLGAWASKKSRKIRKETIG